MNKREIPKFHALIILITSLFLLPPTLYAETFTLNLKQGLNLISLPLTPQSPKIQDVLSPIIYSVRDVWEFDPSDADDSWKHYKPGLEEYSEITAMVPYKGYWIDAKWNSTLRLPGTPLAENTVFYLKQGWNMLPWPYLDSRAVGEALSELTFGVDYDQVSTFSNTAKTQIDFLNNPGVDDFTEFTAGAAYYIHMLTDNSVIFGGYASSGDSDISLSFSGARYTKAMVVLVKFSGGGISGGGIDTMQLSNSALTWDEPRAFSDSLEWELSSGDGIKTVYARFKDGAGNWSEAYSGEIILDTSRPATQIDVVSHGWDGTINVTLTGQDVTSGVDKIYYSTDGSYPDTVYSGPFTLSTAGSYKIKYYSIDRAANAESVNTSSGEVNIDTTPPTGAVTINNGSAYTNTTSVSLTLTASDNDGGSGVDKTRFSNDGGSWSLPEDYADSKSWDLPSVEGPKTVYVKYQDTAGNWSEVYSSQILLDTTAPSTLISGIDGNWHAAVEVSLTASDTGAGVGVIYYSLDGTQPAILYTAPFTISSEGIYSVKYFSLDKAGNAESVKISANQAKIDTTAPTGTITINAGSSYTNMTTVSLSLTAIDNTSGSGIAYMRFSNDGAAWFTPENYSESKLWDLPSGDAAKTVYVRYQDVAGNWSEVYCDDITLDTMPPVVKITSPADGSVVEDEVIFLEWTVDGEVFTEYYTLSGSEEKNVITKSAIDPAGNSGSDTINVYVYLGELIGPEGGEVTSRDGSIKISIPSGALTETKRINVLSLSPAFLEDVTPSGTSLLSAVECRPYGTVFSKAVEIRYILSGAEVPGTAVELGFYDAQQYKILSTGQVSQVASDGYTVKFSIQHFSTYAALKAFVSQGAPIGVGVQIPLPDMLTGAFSHAIPISAPPGRKGIQPSLGLSYRSSNSNSWVGLGFSLNPGYIARSTRLGPPAYNDQQDTFYLITEGGTTELVNLVDNLYQSKIEGSFTKFFKQADDSWKVLSKDGSVLKFGETSYSKEGSSKGTFAWYLTKAVDTNGNYIGYSYTKDQGKSYLWRIEYTGNEMGLSPTQTVEFFLEARDDVASSYISSAKIATAKRLKEIHVKVNNDLVWRYELEYAYSPKTRRSLLVTVTQKSADDRALPPQRLKYQ
ncbi:MAG: SpvB/TcaC N-terminal domain-containing protein [Candidatus Omnitrophota bacterium]